MDRNPTIPQINASNTKSAFLSANAAVEAASVRREQLNGEEHLVAPVVMLVEGTLAPSNSQYTQLALSSVFGRFEGRDWNGRPITLGHPKDTNGVAISANSGTVVEQEHIGALYNCFMDEQDLKGELWINLKRVEELDRAEINNRITAMESGETVEVSVGVFVLTVDRKGVYKDEPFDQIWLESAADHIAVLAEGDIGACSIEDGCGAPRINEKAVEMPKKKRKLDALKDILKGNKAESEPKPKANCECGGKGECQCGSKNTAQVFSINSSDKYAQFKKFYVNGGSYGDISSAVRIAAYTQDPDFAWLVEIYEDYFVYETWSQPGYFARDYEVRDDGTITIGSEVTAVRPETTFVPVNIEVNQMNVPELASSLIENGRTRFEESDREFLEGLSEDQLQKMQPTEETQPEPVDDPAQPNEPEVKVKEEQDKPAIEDQPQERSIERFLEAAPNEVREVVQEGLQARESKRKELTAQIKAFKGNPFSDEELAAKSTTELSKIAAMAHRPDYTGAAGSKQTPQRDALEANRPPQVFQIGKPNGAAGKATVTA